ncbi:MAG: MBL fold metallo-hydrolase [Myxococcota bacterium]
MDIDVCWVGTATVLMEIGPLRVLTDPALNVTPSSRYAAGFGLHYRRTEVPRLPPEGLGRIDLVLLSHDEHGDNLDEAGRALLPTAGVVVTTESGAARLAATDAAGATRYVGLAPGETTTVSRDGFTLEITATPARHGPPGSLPLVGPVIGFALAWDGQEHGVVYVSGDTVHTAAVDALADELRVGTAFLHVGAATFPILGRVTMNGHGAARIVDALDPTVVVPIHQRGWSHFREPPAETIRTLADAGYADRLEVLIPGTWTTLSP